MHISRSGFWRALFAAAMAVGLSFPALADPAGDASEAEMHRYADRASAAFSAGVEAHNNGNDKLACAKFSDAGTLYENAIHASLGNLLNVDKDQQFARQVNKDLQANVDASRDNARKTCATQVAPVKSQATIDDENRRWMQSGSRQKLYQALLNSAWLKASDAAESYAAARYTEACASSRLAAALYRSAATNRLERQPNEYFNINQKMIDSNAARSAADETAFYCKDAKVAAAAAPAVLPGGTRQERVAEGMRYQGMGNQLNTQAFAEYEAKSFGPACDHFRASAEARNQFMLLISIYQEAPDANAADPKDFAAMLAGRDRVVSNAKGACDAYQEQWSHQSWPTPQDLAATGLAINGQDQTAALKAFYALVDYWHTQWPSKERLDALTDACMNAPGTRLSRACEAVQARFPGAPIESCWFLERGIEDLVAMGGLRAPVIGRIYEQLNQRMSCKPMRIAFSTTAGNEGLTEANGLVNIVVKPMPDRPAARRDLTKVPPAPSGAAKPAAKRKAKPKPKP